MRVWRNLRFVLVLVPLFGLAYLLPPDTSWAQVKRVGTLRACVPDHYPPLVTGAPERPGIDVELLRALVERLGLGLQLVTNPAIGRDFNPRNWRVTRAQCQVIAGGVVATALTRSFLETTQPYLRTGWVTVGPSASGTVEGRRVAVLVGASGLDRIALSNYLREQGATTLLVSSSEALVEAIESGSAEVGVTGALVARDLAGDRAWRVAWVPSDSPRPGVAIGLWKGDVTLKRHLQRALRRVQDDGTLAAIVERYELAPVEAP